MQNSYSYLTRKFTIRLSHLSSTLKLIVKEQSKSTSAPQTRTMGEGGLGGEVYQILAVKVINLLNLRKAYCLLIGKRDSNITPARHLNGPLLPIILSVSG